MKVSCQFQHKIKQDNAAKELKIQVPDCAQAVCQFIMLLVTQGNWVYVHKGTRNKGKTVKSFTHQNYTV